MLAGTYSLLAFIDFWIQLGLDGASPLWFGLLSFAILYRPLRSLYSWWLLLWIEPPRRPWDDGPPQRWQGTIDVMTTAMPGEPYEMLEATLGAVAALDGLSRAFLLDGAGSPALRRLCERLGVVHVDCRGIAGAKAGKINHCLERHSTADAVVVIDPDHVPKREFLERVRAPLADPKVGFVQVVQAYGNLRSSWVAWAAAEQTFSFYGPTMMGLSGLGLATAIGANCTFRRAALDSIGGHAVHLAEDALTSMRLHAQGWRSVYLPWRGSHGLVPTDLATFWKQQLKWSAGMTQLLLREYPRLFRRFDATARVHYLFSSTYYLGSLASLLSVALPILFLLFDFSAVRVSVSAFMAHFAPYLLFAVAISLLTQCCLTHREERGLSLRGMLLEHATQHVHAWGVVSAIGGRAVPFLPTPKAGHALAPPRLLLPLWGSLLASLSAIAWAWLRTPVPESGTLLMMSFAASNALLLLPVLTQDFWLRVDASALRSLR